jgi:prolyl-tRNA synthetase
MSHGDDDGLRLPPTVAPQQVVVVPIARDPEQAEAVEAEARSIAAELRAAQFGNADLRVLADLRDRGAPDKRWEWIRKGVPVVIEVGPRDIEEGVVAVRRRDSEGFKPDSLARASVAAEVPRLLEEIQRGYFESAANRLAEQTASDIADRTAFEEWFDDGSGEGGSSKGFVRAPWSEAPESEEIMERLKVSVRCLPSDQRLAPNASCVLTGQPAVVEAVFAKAY